MVEPAKSLATCQVQSQQKALLAQQNSCSQALTWCLDKVPPLLHSSVMASHLPALDLWAL